MKTYTKRTNAKRAAIAAGIPKGEVEVTVHKVAGEKARFGFKRMESQQAPAKAAAAARGAPARVVRRDPRVSAGGITRPRAGGKCDAVWRALDSHPTWKLGDARAWAEKGGHNVNNLVCEFYRWRKFNRAST